MLPKFNKTIDELENRFEKWMYVLKNLPKLERIPEKLKEKIFLKLFEKAEIAKFNKDETHMSTMHSKKTMNTGHVGSIQQLYSN
ncbi:MAG: hypothetical protein EA361_00185 [Bacteroidetes bacterium]|nr:MAG: hypothetical protein EA361_00185 [Bacteroidota bacterium]